MYLDFYGFQENPFSLTPDPRFVFPSKTHKEAFAHLLYGINQRTGFIALTGEIGSGKTTVLRAFLKQLDADHHRTALIFNPSLSPSDLLQCILREFGIPIETSNSFSLLDSLNSFLLQQNAEGRTVVLVIDEAQSLDPSVLEQIRLISNLETDKEKLIQIVLSGQPELGQKLRRKDLRQLSQRITVHYHLQPMDFQDTVDYIKHRINVAGGRGHVLFSRGALKRIYRYSQGLPRLINAACDKALLAGYTKNAARISPSIAALGIKDLTKYRGANNLLRRLIWVSTLILLAVILGVFYLSGSHFRVSLDDSRQVEAKKDTKKEPSVTEGKELSDFLAAEIGEISESESARRAFNALAALWKVPPIPEGGHWSVQDRRERAAIDRKLRLYRFSGNLGALLRIDYPAIIELTTPGIPGKRYVSLVGVERDQLLVDPPIAARKSISFNELEKQWSGQCIILWKDPLNLSTIIMPGSEGDHVERLQGLLKEAGVYKESLTGVYDGDTLAAVKEFQSSSRIKQDGIVGSQTLMVLYRSVNRFEVPRLTAGQK
jgi:general secretion pathway protein A